MLTAWMVQSLTKLLLYSYCIYYYLLIIIQTPISIDCRMLSQILVRWRRWLTNTNGLVGFRVLQQAEAVAVAAQRVPTL